MTWLIALIWCNILIFCPTAEIVGAEEDVQITHSMDKHEDDEEYRRTSETFWCGQQNYISFILVQYRYQNEYNLCN